MANLDGVGVKLCRAKGLVSELRLMIEPLALEATRSIVGAASPTDPSTLIYRATRVPPIDPMAAAIAGDIVHNLRSALDHLAWQLVLLDNGQPNEDTSFPLHESATNRNGNPRVLTIAPGIRDSAIMTAVEAMQPFAEAQYGHNPRTDSLRIIRRLNNIDKHRLLLTVVHALDRDLPAYWGADDGDPKPRISFNLGALSTNAVVATFDFDGATPPALFEPHLKLAVTIGEPDADWGAGLDIIDVLDRLRRSVAREINIHIAPLMSEPPLPWD